MKRKLLVPVLLLLSLTLGLTACGKKGKEKEETSEKSITENIPDCCGA